MFTSLCNFEIIWEPVWRSESIFEIAASWLACISLTCKIIHRLKNFWKCVYLLFTWDFKELKSLFNSLNDFRISDGGIELWPEMENDLRNSRGRIFEKPTWVVLRILKGFVCLVNEFVQPLLGVSKALLHLGAPGRVHGQLRCHCWSCCCRRRWRRQIWATLIHFSSPFTWLRWTNFNVTVF